MTSPNRNRYKELWEKGTQTGQLRLSTERFVARGVSARSLGYRRLNTSRGSNNHLRLTWKFQNLAIYGDGSESCSG